MTKCYAIARGRTMGIFYDWSTVEASINGYPGAVWKSFYSAKEAESFLHPPPSRKKDSGGPLIKSLPSLPLLPLIGETMVYVEGLSTDQVGTYGIIILPPNGE